MLSESNAEREFGLQAASFGLQAVTLALSLEVSEALVMSASQRFLMISSCGTDNEERREECYRG